MAVFDAPLPHLWLGQVATGWLDEDKFGEASASLFVAASLFLLSGFSIVLPGDPGFVPHQRVLTESLQLLSC